MFKVTYPTLLRTRVLESGWFCLIKLFFHIFHKYLSLQSAPCFFFYVQVGEPLCWSELKTGCGSFRPNPRVSVLCCDIIIQPSPDWPSYEGKTMAQHSKQTSRQSDDAQQFSNIPQSNTAWHASSVHAASPAASTQQQQHAAQSQQLAPPTPQARHSPSAEHMDSSSQNRQASRQWTQQSAGTIGKTEKGLKTF